MDKLKYIYIFILVAAGWLPDASVMHAQQVTEYVQTDSLKVGDTFTYALALQKDRTYDDIIFPDSIHFGESIEIRNRQRYKVSESRDSLVYQLQFFGTVDLKISALPVQLVSDSDTNTVYTNPVHVAFKTVLQEEQEDFRPLKPIFDFALAIWPYLLALLFAGLLGWYLYRRYYEQKSGKPAKPEKTFEPAPFKNPLEILARTIKQLKSFTFSSREDYKQFYINLGDAIRKYFEDLYHIPALESTSREIIRELERRSVDGRLIQQTREVLREADMVKFAKFEPTDEQAQQALQKGESFVRVARKIDSDRIEHLHRQHKARMSEERMKHELEHQKETEGAV